jgi:hypothetical protein
MNFFTSGFIGALAQDYYAHDESICQQRQSFQ